MPNACISVDSVSFERGGKRILEDISWEVSEGEHWALLGANGSGKTTLLKIITGYEWPTTGSLAVLGKRFGHYDLRELRKLIGWVSTALGAKLPNQDTALEVVASGLDASLGVYRELGDDEWAAAHSALEAVGSMGVASQPYETLSQGEQQRVRIARALVRQPALLILDEPCAGLDPISRADFLDDIARMAKDGPRIVLVTHHIEEIGPWITHVHALAAGRTVYSGEVAGAMNAKVMEHVFGSACVVTKDGDAYRLSVSRE